MNSNNTSNSTNNNNNSITTSINNSNNNIINNENSNFKFVDPDTVVTPLEQKQYKIQLLLHINSILLININQIVNNDATILQNLNTKEQNWEQVLIQKFLHRVHSNLQCISRLNQGELNAKPTILEPPIDNNSNNNSNNGNYGHPALTGSRDTLNKLYALLERIFQFW